MVSRFSFCYLYFFICLLHLGCSFLFHFCWAIRLLSSCVFFNYFLMYYSIFCNLSWHCFLSLIHHVKNLFSSTTFLLSRVFRVFSSASVIKISINVSYLVFPFSFFIVSVFNTSSLQLQLALFSSLSYWNLSAALAIFNVS